MKEILTKYYSLLFEKELLEEILENGTYKKIKEGEKLMEIGQYVTYMPLLISGAIKVLREDKDGDELLLYFLERGDTCAMTMTCCMGHTKSEIRAIAEMDTELIMIPVQKMEDWTGKYKTWRNFVFDSYHNRLMEMLDTIDSIAFYNMDERLVKYLNDKTKYSEDHFINSTHQDIAYELHTSRVVISRLLKKLEKNGRIKLHRNRIEMLKV